MTSHNDDIERINAELDRIRQVVAVLFHPYDYGCFEKRKRMIETMKHGPIDEDWGLKD